MSPQLGFSSCEATSALAESSGTLAFIKGPIDVLFQLLVCLHKPEQQGRLVKQRHRSRKQGSSLVTPGLASRRDLSPTATARRPEVVGWAPLGMTELLTTSFGTVGQWKTVAGRWPAWREGHHVISVRRHLTKNPARPASKVVRETLQRRGGDRRTPACSARGKREGAQGPRCGKKKKTLNGVAAPSAFYKVVAATPVQSRS